MGCFVVARFLLTNVLHDPTAIAELLVNFGGPIHISGMAEATAVKFCTQGDYTMSQKNDTNVAHYNFNAHQPILVIFGRGIAERIRY